MQDEFLKFLAGTTYNADQVTFVNVIVSDLCHNGVMEPEALYDHPYREHAPTDPDDLFEQEEIAEIVSIIRKVNDTARAATA